MTLAPPTAPGLGRNARLFALLVLVNGFVGTMVGVERTLVPLVGAQEFGLASKAAVLSFIATFGIVKAVANLAAGAWSDHVGRRRLLVAGWLVGLPAPLLLMFAPAPHWWLVLVANVLLGVNQGLCWSTAVIMKVDIAGERRRGLAMGLNEFAGYAAVGLAAFATGWLAAQLGPRPWPFAIGLGAAVLGLLLSWLLVPETLHLARSARSSGPASGAARSAPLRALPRFTLHARLGTLHQAGLVNNLNDGVVWGLAPLLFAAALPTAEVGLLAALYPLSWGVLQLGTGHLSDRHGRKGLIAGGLALQALALAAMARWPGLFPWALAMLLLGLGTAMVYPTLLGAVADHVAPAERGSALGVYRFWRDLGFAAGALGGGLLADLAGLEAAFLGTAALTLASGLHVAWRLQERAPVPRDPAALDIEVSK